MRFDVLYDQLIAIRSKVIKSVGCINQGSIIRKWQGNLGTADQETYIEYHNFDILTQLQIIFSASEQEIQNETDQLEIYSQHFQEIMSSFKVKQLEQEEE
ncbi:unnamed protein product [Paramecium octaurelia]|uniref:Uncharacterized protein n=1 Tax=Paramecium octaurelia TaxID=43137 RepID=A0A8S1X294_PAROT|nr:unnamed protein product [Paramecium octaurelia]